MKNTQRTIHALLGLGIATVVVAAETRSWINAGTETGNGLPPQTISPTNFGRAGNEVAALFAFGIANAKGPERSFFAPNLPGMPTPKK